MVFLWFYKGYSILIFLFVSSVMNINIALRNAVEFLDQFYEKRRLIVISTPTAADFYYRLQVGTLQVQRENSIFLFADPNSELHYRY